MTRDLRGGRNWALGVFVLALALAWPTFAQRRFSRDPNAYSTPEQAAEAERALQSHPDDESVLKRLLCYYESNWQSAGPQRLRLILRTIENRPEIALDQLDDPRSLLVNPDDREAYGKARQLWIEQVRRYPDRARILENAAICLRLTDREAAADWLRRAMVLDPERAGFLKVALADVYAAAISGISGMNPWEGPTSLDAAETRSAFAQHARSDALTDSELAARTGWALYLATEAIHRLNLGDADYDAIAEELLLKSAALRYPKPAALNMLGTFYARQKLKKSGQILPQSHLVAVPAEEHAKRLISRTTEHVVTGESVAGPVQVTVDIVVGTDGHVWEATAREAPTELIRSAAVTSAMNCVFEPLDAGGEVVRVATTVEVTIETRP